MRAAKVVAIVGIMALTVGAFTASRFGGQEEEDQRGLLQRQP